MDRQAWTDWAQGCDLHAPAIQSLLRNNAIARRLARRPAEDSNREGHKLRGSVRGHALDVQVGGPPPEKLEPPDPIASWVQRFGLLGKAIEADSQARAHGLSLWVYGVEDGRASHEPLNMPGIQRLVWLRNASRQWVSVMEWDQNPLSPRYLRPRIYRVNFPRGGSALFHHSRVWAWDGIEISTEEREDSLDGGGGSVFDLVWSELKNYGVSQAMAVEAITRLSQAVWKNDNLARAVDQGNAAGAAKHYERLALGGGPLGDYVLAEGESYNVIGRPVAGLEGIMGALESAMVAASEMPEPVILGAQPSTSGLNNESDGLIRAWYDTLAATAQPQRFGPAYSHFYSIASRANNGPTAGVPILGLDIGWPSLWQATPQEKATTRLANAQARTIDVGGVAIISVGESRSDKTVDDEYELAPEGVATVEPEPEVPIEEIEVADAELMPPGESPIGLRAAAQILGRKSPGAAKNFIAARGVPLFRPGAQYAVFESHLRAAMRESMVV